ncbi:YdcH family protein [Limoniibacter endophyticus]|uniref:DUF465 domain-containing protein n=1 Tax=Limoniibacter endophyticus TaxID=1565040 RepID=A0A8J3GJC0_9HYPH|nr:DUF465 domain-containing protein [Limoniibacter endophyticus]GHC77080.1 DUF465 domain-containing protein [Limoniibacter endophyticus]
MSLTNHLEELRKKHGEMERELDLAKHHPSMSEDQLKDIKRRKLALKDEITKLSASATKH